MVDVGQNPQRGCPEIPASRSRVTDACCREPRCSGPIGFAEAEDPCFAGLAESTPTPPNSRYRVILSGNNSGFFFFCLVVRRRCRKLQTHTGSTRVPVTPHVHVVLLTSGLSSSKNQTRPKPPVIPSPPGKLRHILAKVITAPRTEV